MNERSNLLNGKALAETLKGEIGERFRQLIAAGKKTPHRGGGVGGVSGWSQVRSRAPGERDLS